MEPILVIDNYDSFVHNLVHYLEKAGARVEVRRNDRIDLDTVDRWDRVLLSPGPGLPKDAGIMPELIRRYGRTKDIFGVCLGHQAIAEAFGLRLRNLDRVIHGEPTEAHVLGSDPLFQGIPDPFEIGHYHSWVVDDEGVGTSFEVTVRDADGSVMGIRHREYALNGVQFHPESVLTPHGYRIIENWLKRSPS